MFSKILSKISQHKFITVIILLLVCAGGYYGYQTLFKNPVATQYVTATIKKGTLIISVSGSGQVSASDQADIKSKVKSDVSAIYIDKGEEVKTEKLIVKLDSADFQKAVKDAETALETAQLELEKLLSPLDELTLLKAESAVLQAKNSLEKLKLNQETEYQKALETKQRAEDNIVEGYEDAFNAITNAFFDLPTIITGLNDILYSYKIGKSEITIDDYSDNKSSLMNSVDYGNNRYELEKFINSAENNYKTARTKYDANFENYRDASRYSEHDIIEALLEETLETARAMAEAVKNEINILDFWVDYRSRHDLRIYSKVTEYQSDLKSYTSKTNSYLSSLLSVQRSLQDNKEAKLSAERSLAEMEKTHPLDLAASEISLEEKEKSLTDLKAGPDELEIRAKKNAVQQKEDTLLAAKQNLADCSIYVPFDGIITDIKVKKGDSVSAGTALSTIITKQKIAEITLNEIDVAKVKTSQKATITFDAIDNLSITGEVSDIDMIGTVTQGVVNYAVKIAFDTQDERVKPSMSVSVTIITEVRQDVLLIPNAAVKSNNEQYVEVLENNISRTQTVETGLSNDTLTEIKSGLKEGDQVITQIITANTTVKTQTTGTGVRIPGIGGFGR